MSVDPLLEVRGIRKTYGWRRPVVALHGVDLTVNAGEGVLVVGANGAGKTSLLSITAGLRRPTSGALSFGDGVEVGYVPDRPRLPAALSPWELLRTCARLHDLPDERVRSVLERVGLHVDDSAPIRTLSAGQTQRVALAQALIHRPRLLLLDEPLRHLDASGMALVLSALGAHLQGSGGLLVATHRLTEWMGLCSRIVQIRNGVANELGALDEVMGHLHVRIWFTLPRDARVDEVGTPLDAAPPMQGRLVPAASRNTMLAAVREAGGRVLRVEPAVDTLGLQPDSEVTLA